MYKTDWPAIIARVAGAGVLVAGVFLAAGLCTATPHDNSVPNIFDPHATSAESIRHLSHVVLGVTGVIFLVVFTLLTYAVVKFRSRVTDTEREPAQVYGSTQIELAWRSQAAWGSVHPLRPLDRPSALTRILSLGTGVPSAGVQGELMLQSP